MKEPELKKISINKVKVDLDNPNIMSEDKFAALKKTITKFGYIVPIVVDKNLKIADGEHRYLAYKELGMKEIPAYVLDISDPDRRLLRQVMNKLKGEHNLTKDLDEFTKIKLGGIELKELGEFLGEDESYFEEILKLKKIELEQYLTLRESSKEELKKDEFKELKLTLTEAQLEQLKEKFGENVDMFKVVGGFIISQ
jgi:ParB family chromosome partitioning protein